MEIIPASEWGREVTGNPARVDLAKVIELTVHYTGAPSVNVKPDEVAAYIKRTERGHKARPGENMSTIGYNFLIDEYARIWEGRGLTYRNAANGTASNVTSVSVCILVGVKDNKISPEMIEAVRWLREHVSRLAKRQLRVQGHRDHKATSCPGEDLYRLVRNGTFLIPPAGVEPAPVPPVAPAPEPANPCLQTTVKWRSKGECVLLVRRRLKLHGFEVEQGSEVFDRNLVAVVKHFQKTRRLTVDGVVGPKETWPALMRKP
jgi:hypothetical protein